MKILSVCHMFPNRINPNTGVFVKERLKFVTMKCDLTMLAPVPAFPFMDYTSKYGGLSGLEERERFDGLSVYHPRYFMIPKYFKFLDAFFYGRSIASYIEGMFEHFDYDLLDFHWVYPDAIGGLQWARKLGKKTVVTVRGNEAIYYFGKTLMRRIIQKRLSEFDHVIAVSSDLKNKILSEYGVEESRISVVPNGIDTSKFYRMDRSEALEKCHLDGNKRYILTVSRLSSEKGIEFLLRAFKNTKCSEIELIIIGDGPLKADLVATCVELGIDDRVHFLGTIGHADIRAWYNAVDVFCLPSLWEGCPNVIIEALACGIPVVASQVGGIPDLVPGNDYGILVPPGDANILAGALTNAFDGYWDRKKISEYGSANSWKDVADRVIDIYERVLS